MTNQPLFFVPAATAENQESVFAGFAQWCGREIPVLGKRIYSITYDHDGEEWTATVGERLSGFRHPRSRRKRMQTLHPQPLFDRAIVLAIFAGSPFMVVTNDRIGGNIGSKWENPFMVGRPKAIQYFAQC